jgi:DNA-binding NarL/FixJ family response regulator
VSWADQARPAEPRIAIVDDHRLVAALVGAMLEAAGFEAVDAFGPTPDSIADELAAVQPTLTFLDHDLGPAGSGFEVLGRAAALGPVVVLTASEDRLVHAGYLEAGAAGVIAKTAGPSALFAAVELVMAGEPVTPDPAREELLAELRAARIRHRRAMQPFTALTGREAETLVALGEGDSAADIAEAWFVSLATVRSHIRSILMKLGVGSQLEAVAMAHRAGWFRDTHGDSSILMMTPTAPDSTMAPYGRKSAG